MKTKKVIQYIVKWLKHYVDKSSCDSFVVGVSGGIDSAVTSTLAAKTGFSIRCIEMPIYQEKKQISRSTEHVKWLTAKYLNAKSVQINLTPVLETFIKCTADHLDTAQLKKLALANTRSRFRMATLYYFAQKNNSIVVGTGNKVEDFGVGFFTKYGDGGVDISPIASLLKTEIYSVGKELGICQSILDAQPTDGLWEDNRTDEDQLGATYPELEWAMQFNGKIDVLNSREKQVLNIYKTLNKSNRHKMQDIPVCIIPKNLK